MRAHSQRRGLQSLRTQATRKATNNLSSPEIYIRLTALEMERARRVMERDRLIERVRVLDERIIQIGIEQSGMLCQVDHAHPSHLHSPTKDNHTHPDSSSQFGFTY